MLDSLFIVALSAWSIALAWVDFREHRLPDVLTLPAIPVALAYVAIARPTVLGFAVTAAVVLVVLGFAAHRVADLGLGDVKLLPSVGIVASTAANPAGNLAEWLVGVSLMGGVHATIHLVVTRNRHAHIPFGPSILGGLVVAAVVG